MSNTYQDIKTTLYAICKSYLTGKPYSSNTEIFDFEANIAVTKWPDKKVLIGIGDISIQNTGETHMVSCSFCVSTTPNDSNLELMTEVIGGLYDKFKPGKKVADILDPTGQVVGCFVTAKDVTLLPVGKTSTRPLQEIGVQFSVSYQNP